MSRSKQSEASTNLLTFNAETWLASLNEMRLVLTSEGTDDLVTLNGRSEAGHKERFDSVFKSMVPKAKASPTKK